MRVSRKGVPNRPGRNADPTRFFGGRVDVIQRPLSFGGKRQLFLCPHCRRPRTTLYLRRGSFRCRVCAELRYVSQTLDYAGRQYRAMEKLQARLTEEG